MSVKTTSQGGKVVPCVRCSGDIQPYAGREVADNRYAHHPGQCRDALERETSVREVAGQLSFGWRCDHIEPGHALGPRICSEQGSDRAEYVAHVKGHGATETHGTYVAIRPRKRPPAVSLPKIEVPTTKFLRWTERKYGEWQAGVGNPLIGECERRGQFWSEADTPHSVWVVPLERAPWEPMGRPPAPVQLYVIEPGHYTTDWQEMRRERRELNRVAKRRAA
jgi:hypothetical protein